MRWFLVLVAAVIGAGISLGLSTLDADAGPPPAISAPLIAPTLIEQTGYWKRYCRRYGCGADAVLPDADVAVDVDVDDDAPAAIIVLPPPRPASCIAIGTATLRRRALQQSLSRAEIAKATHD
ncbi:MAG TPA: hypothetical protein VHK26_08135 [Methyloceanibacter sp.]|jgi:hypothetical protein|nr:hypothetical protein [Methyloceanibacter sp.]